METVQYTSEAQVRTVYALDFSNDGCLLAFGGTDCTVRIWDLEQRLEIYKFTMDDWTMSVMISPDSCFTAAGSINGQVCLWDLKTALERPTMMHDAQSAVKSLAFSSDGKYLVTGGDIITKVWELGSGACLLTLGNDREVAHPVCLTPDDRWIVSASEDGSIRFWDRTTGTIDCILNAHQKHVKSMAFRPQGGYFATASEDRTVRVWSYGPRKQT